MNLAPILESQYLSALMMLEIALQQCPDPLWDHEQDENRVWRVAFHTLFYTHLYLQPTEADFRPWPKARGEAQFFGSFYFDANRPLVIAAPYTRDEIFEYLAFVRDEVARLTPRLDYTAPSGFDWIPLDKLELQLYNIRHIQQHTGELYERLGIRAQIRDLSWIGQLSDIEEYQAGN